MYKIENKIINPLEKLDIDEISQYESAIADFYEYCKEKKPESFQNLIKFHEIDLSSYLNEDKKLDIDFEQLLENDQ